jgi:peptidylprolyl isomerase
LTFAFDWLKISEVNMKKYAVLLGVLVLMAALVMGCGGGGGAAEGDTVSVHYTGSLADGTVFDSSEDREPLTFVVGSGTVISGFDEAVRGMEVGQTKTVTIPAAEAYGEYREDLVVVLPREEFEEELEVGDSVTLKNVTTNEQMSFTVIDISDSEVTLDGNHPLAGQDLIFEIRLVSIN